jgi:hypothetical protein
VVLPHPPYPTVVVFQAIRSAVSRKRAKAASSVQSSSMGVVQLKFGGVTDGGVGAEKPCFLALSCEGGAVMIRLARGEGAGAMRGWVFSRGTGGCGGLVVVGAALEVAFTLSCVSVVVVGD